MALVIEDGSVVADATSYVDVDEARAFALARGITLSDDDAVLEPQLIKAMDYLEAKQGSYRGEKVSEDQVFQWPRDEVYVDGYLLPSDAIPNTLKRAQCQLVIEQYNGVDIIPTQGVGFPIKEVVGPIQTQYSEKLSTAQILTAVENWLAPLLINSRGTLRTLRI